MNVQLGSHLSTVHVKRHLVALLVPHGMAHHVNPYHARLVITGLACIAPYKHKIVLQVHTGVD